MVAMGESVRLRETIGGSLGRVASLAVAVGGPRCPSGHGGSPGSAGRRPTQQAVASIDATAGGRDAAQPQLAIAETGAIVLDAGPGMGRRALAVVPDLHVVVVRQRT